jgi:hypothetical protein
MITVYADGGSDGMVVVVVVRGRELRAGAITTKVKQRGIAPGAILSEVGRVQEQWAVKVRVLEY